MQAGARRYFTTVPDNPAERGLAVKLDSKNFVVSNADYPPSWLLSPGTNTQFAESCYGTWNQCEQVTNGKFRYALKKEALPADGYDYFTSRFFEVSWGRYKDNWGSVTGKTDLFATIAYTDPGADKADADANTTLVWQVQVADGGNNVNWNTHGAYYNNWRLRCITADCSVDGNQLRFSGNSKVSTVSLDGATAQWKTFTIR